VSPAVSPFKVTGLAVWRHPHGGRSLATDSLSGRGEEDTLSEQLVGTVTHFFKGPSVAVVKLTDAAIGVGDEVRFKGHTSDFTERITSMEVDHRKVEQAKKGDEVAIQVVARARPHDQVFKLVPEA
jgi:putative protease